MRGKEGFRLVTKVHYRLIKMDGGPKKPTSRFLLRGESWLPKLLDGLGSVLDHKFEFGPTLSCCDT